jgi:putative FmdB family regulatory protein
MIRAAMPIYDYRCDHCGHAFSTVQSYDDGPLEKCPNCGKRPRRLIVPSAIVFKGSGWYKTDSRPPEKSESKPDAPKPDAKKPETKGEGKTDKRPPKGEAAS